VRHTGLTCTQKKEGWHVRNNKEGQAIVLQKKWTATCQSEFFDDVHAFETPTPAHTHSHPHSLPPTVTPAHTHSRPHSLPPTLTRNRTRTRIRIRTRTCTRTRTSTRHTPGLSFKLGKWNDLGWDPNECYRCCLCVFSTNTIMSAYGHGRSCGAEV